MYKTLKGKITQVYLYLVLIIAIIGTVSVINLFQLTKSMDGLMIDNYKSINASNKMMEILEKQNITAYRYIYKKDNKSVDEFYEMGNNFYYWFSIESNNITEHGEKEYVDKIKNKYTQYIISFSKLQEIQSKNNIKDTMEYYNSTIIPNFQKVRDELKALSNLNEKVMIENKNSVTEDTQRSMNIILIFSIIAVMGSFFVATYFVSKFLEPINLLTETMKKVKEGDLEQRAPIIFNDEIGEMANEFNNMTTRLKQFENSTMGKLLEEKNKSLAIVKGISDPIIVLDPNSKIILLNKSCEEIFDIDEQKVIGKYFLEIIRNGDLYEYIFNLKREDKKNSTEKIFKINKKNKEFYFNVNVSFIKNKDLKINGLIVFFQNITQLRAVEKMKSDFISSISHEFKTPLTSLIMGTDLLMDNNLGYVNEKQLEILETIRQDSNKLLELVDDLLKLSKIEYDKSLFSRKNTNIEPLIEKSIREFHNIMKNKKICLKKYVDINLPYVNIDEEKITWVLNNLLSNAVKFTEEEGKIILRVFKEDKYLEISVEDNGIGIPELYKDKVFDKFVQVHEKDFENGTGLGLSISKEIVELHGGNIFCESKEGVGSKFIFRIPLKNV